MLDINKPVQTRDGRKARIVCRDAVGPKPIVAMITVPGEPSEEYSQQYYPSGNQLFCASSQDDILNIPERVKVRAWLNAYSDGSLGVYSTKEAADAIDGRIACLEIDIEVEKGSGIGCQPPRLVLEKAS